MFSVIIPTMWRSRELSISLELLDNTSNVGEILLINNDVNRTPLWFFSRNWNKVKVFNSKENLYVNPAFNLGVKHSRYDKICLLQDDIVFDTNIFNLLDNFVNEDVGCIGCDIKTSLLRSFDDLKPIPISEIRIEPCPLPIYLGYALMMVFHKKNFIPIDESLKIHLGEEWISYTHQRLNKLPLIFRNFFLVCSSVMTTSGLPEFKKNLEEEGKAHKFIEDKLDEIFRENVYSDPSNHVA